MQLITAVKNHPKFTVKIYVCVLRLAQAQKGQLAIMIDNIYSALVHCTSTLNHEIS